MSNQHRVSATQGPAGLRCQRQSFSILLLVLALLPGAASAQLYTQEDLEPVHWAFSSLFGTGWYQLDNNRSVFILRMPPRFTLRKPEDEAGQQQSAIELHLPLTVGFHNIDDIPGIIEPDNFGTISFTPGIEMEIPITPEWALRPFIKGGYGYEFNSGDEAWIYNLGVKSRYQIFTPKVTWSILSNVYVGGYHEVGQGSDDIGGFLLGLEASHRGGEDGLDDSSYLANWHLSYTKLSRKLNFIDPEKPRGFDSVDNYFTAGLSFSPPGGRWNFWLYKPEQLGLAVEFSPDGNYVALKFNTRSWFTQ